MFLSFTDTYMIYLLPCQLVSHSIVAGQRQGYPLVSMHFARSYYCSPHLPSHPLPPFTMSFQIASPGSRAEAGAGGEWTGKEEGERGGEVEGGGGGAEEAGEEDEEGHLVEVREYS